MDLQYFINEITCLINKNKYKLLLKDIIDIYEGSYDSYGNYVETMETLNNKINNQINDLSYGVNFNSQIFYEPEHNILEEWQYDYLVRLGSFKNGMIRNR